MSKRITVETFKNEIIETYNKEKSITKTSKILKLSWQFVKKTLDTFGIVQTPSYVVTPTKEELESLYLKHGSFLEISKVTKINSHRISKYFYQYGLNELYPLFNTCDENFFERDTEEAWYWAGFIAADGSINKTVLDIALCSKDIEHLKKFKVQIKTSKEIVLRPPTTSYYNDKSINSTECCRLMVASKKIVTDLKKWNIIPNKTLIYSLPDELLIHPMIRHFIRGIIDGDGCWRIKDKKHNLHSVELCGTYKICEQINNIFHINNLISQNYSPHKVNFSKAYAIAFNSQKDLEKIREFLYKDSTIFLQRKFDIANNVKFLTHDDRCPKLDVNLIKELYKKDDSIRRISKKIGISRDRVLNCLVENNIEHNIHRKNSINEDFFENKTTEKFYYWCGYFVGQICIENNSTIILNDSIEKLQQVNKLLESTYKINKTKLFFNSRKFITNFEKLKESLLDILDDENKISDFFVGYIETRGYFLKSSVKPFKFLDRIETIEIIEKILEKINIIPTQIKYKKTRKSLIFNNENFEKLLSLTKVFCRT